MAIAKDESVRDLAQQNMAFLNRQNFSFPPDHGARIVTTILNSPELKADWEAELEEVRLGMLELRQHRGMFSRLGTTPDKVETLRAKHGIYMVGDSRMNIAGLNAKTIPVLAKAIIDAGI